MRYILPGAASASWPVISLQNDRQRRRRLDITGLHELVDFRVLDTAKLDSLVVDAPFDGAFSNFSGLNCVQDLSQVAGNLARLVKPGARIFCVW